MNQMIEQLRVELRNNSDEATRKSTERFFKEAVVAYGVKSALVGRIAKSNFDKIKNISKIEIFELCDELWKSGVMEEVFVACDWSYRLNKQYEKSDFELFEKWVSKYVSNWAMCDTFCNHNVGAIVEMYPEFLDRLKQWSKSDNRWLKRAAAVSLIIPAKKGKFLNDVFEIADTLLMDTDDMVQKGYGWMLKVASQSHQDEVFKYVIQNKSKMPRTALRYAIEKMPKELKLQAMAK